MNPAPSLTAKATRPPAYPEGWFQVAYSDDVVAGQLRSLH